MRILGGLSMAANSAESVRAETKIFIRALPLQALLGLAILVGVLYGGYYHAPEGAIPAPSSGELGAKVAYALRCFVFPAWILAIMIGATGRARAKVGAENPLSGNEAAMEVHKKRIKNTLEQTFIFVMLSLFLSTLLEKEEMKYVFLTTILFLVGRVLFWVGYGIHPAYREAGNIVTFGTVLISLAISVYLVCSRDLMFGWVVCTSATAAIPVLLVVGAIYELS